MIDVESDDAAYRLLERMRWPAGRPDKCPHCSQPCRFYFLASQGGMGYRTTRTGAGTARRLWKCGACRRQFSVLHGTPLQGTRISLRIWLQLIYRLCESRRAVSTGDLLDMGLSRQALWRMIQRLKQASPDDGPFGELLAAAAAKHQSSPDGRPEMN